MSQNVHIENVLDFVTGQLFERLTRRNAGIIHQDVYIANSRTNLRGRLLYLLLVTNVHHKPKRFLVKLIADNICSFAYIFLEEGKASEHGLRQPTDVPHLGPREP